MFAKEGRKERMKEKRKRRKKERKQEKKDMAKVDNSTYHASLTNECDLMAPRIPLPHKVRCGGPQL